MAQEKLKISDVSLMERNDLTEKDQNSSQENCYK